ncbi:MAG: hypothetical protein G8345_01960 [Magnetococcales bacterium]|nr:hypothetical protein [Magnetococcales bacterium]NGZ25634.1 hypothetical protein [Magnetococcales bacterium]
MAEKLLSPNGKKLKCSKCKNVFFQEPPAAKPKVTPPPVSMEEDFDQFETNTVIGFADAEKPPVDAAPPAPAKPISDQSLESTVFNFGMGDDFDQEEEEANTRLSEDDLDRLLKNTAEAGAQQAKKNDFAKEMGISDETLMALEEQEAMEDEDMPPTAPRAKPSAKPPTKANTLISMLEDAYPDEEDKHPTNPSIILEEVDPAMDDLPTLIAPPKKEKKEVREVKEVKPPAQAAAPLEPDLDSIFAELENNREGDEIDLDAETFVASRSKSSGGGGLSSDEEEALASLGFNPGLSHDEEEALGSLGLRGNNKPMERLTSDDEDEDEDLIPARARNPEPPPSMSKGASYQGKKSRPLGPILWMVASILGVVLIGSVLYTHTGMREWLEFKSFDLDNPFRIVSLESRWVEKDYGQLLIVEGSILNSTSIAHVVPLVKVIIMDKENKPVAETIVVPGRLLTDKDMEGTQDTLRTIITMQGDTKRMKPPKVYPKKELGLVAIFINPPEGAERFQTEFVYSSKEASRSGGTKTFQSIF